MESHKILRIVDTVANLTTSLNNAQIGISNDTYQFVYKDSAGHIHFSANQKYGSDLGNNIFGSVTCDNLTLAAGGTFTINDLVGQRILFGAIDHTIGQDALLTWDASNRALNIGSTIQLVNNFGITVHGTGTIISSYQSSASGNVEPYQAIQSCNTYGFMHITGGSHGTAGKDIGYSLVNYDSEAYTATPKGYAMVGVTDSAGNITTGNYYVQLYQLS